MAWIDDIEGAAGSSELVGSAVCRYSETLRDADKCGKPATHFVSKKGFHKMPVCDEHAKLYDRLAFDGGRYIVEPNANCEPQGSGKDNV